MNKPINAMQKFAEMRADYMATKDSRFVRRRKGLPAMGGTADYHFASDAEYIRLLEKARDLDRNDALIGQMVDRAVANIIGDGFVLHPETGYAPLDNYLWERWHNWANDPNQSEITNEFCWHDLEHLATRAMFIDGEAWIVAVDNGSGGYALQFVEADQVQTPQDMPTNGNAIVLGVEMSENRRKEAVHVLRRDVNPRGQTVASDRLPIFAPNGMRQVFQVFKPNRPTQSRGVTALARTFEIAGMAEDINFATLVQRQMVSCIAFIRKKDASHDGTPSTGAGGGGYGNERQEETEYGQQRLIDDIAPGMELSPPIGESVEGFSPQVPSPGFFEQMKMVLQMIGLNLGLPYVQMMMDASETNFSGWRGAVSEARKCHREHQINLKNRLHTPVYQLKVNEWVEDDSKVMELAKEGSVPQQLIAAHRWNLPAARYIQPEIEAAADLLRVRNGLISPRRLHAEHQRDFEEIATETIEDNKFAILRAMAAAKLVNASQPDNPVHWRELLSLPTPDGTSIALQQMLTTPEEKQNEKSNP